MFSRSSCQLLRLPPSDEAKDLLELTRDLATRELLPKVAEAEESETFPRDVFRTLGRAGLPGLPYPEEYGGGGQPYARCTCRSSRRSPSVWATVGVGGLRARAFVLRPGHGRDRGAAGEVAPGDAGRGAARCLLPVGGARGLRPAAMRRTKART